ncbi:MAG: septum formation initiator family protein [Victivallales bacterium]|nr:septum formation initiator family protein [Victivallales bacterium]
MRKTLNLIFYVLLAGVLLVGGGMLLRTWGELRRMRGRVAELEAELRAKHNESLELHQEIHDLRTNPRAVEKVAREKFKLVGDDETVIMFEMEVDDSTQE